MLLGNLYAICASALIAIYISYIDDIIDDDYPFHLYLAINSGYAIILTYFMSVYTGNRIQILTNDSINGLLGFSSNSYLLLLIVGIIFCMV